MNAHQDGEENITVISWLDITSTQFTCVDASVEVILGSDADNGGYLLYTEETPCGYFFPCSDK